jgi:hypothetical protein
MIGMNEEPPDKDMNLINAARQDGAAFASHVQRSTDSDRREAQSRGRSWI